MKYGGAGYPVLTAYGTAQLIVVDPPTGKKRHTLRIKGKLPMDAGSWDDEVWDADKVVELVSNASKSIDVSSPFVIAIYADQDTLPEVRCS